MKNKVCFFCKEATGNNVFVNVVENRSSKMCLQHFHQLVLNIVWITVADIENWGCQEDLAGWHRRVMGGGLQIQIHTSKWVLIFPSISFCLSLWRFCLIFLTCFFITYIQFFFISLFSCSHFLISTSCEFIVPCLPCLSLLFLILLFVSIFSSYPVFNIFWWKYLHLVIIFALPQVNPATITCKSQDMKGSLLDHSSMCLIE